MQREKIEVADLRSKNNRGYVLLRRHGEESWNIRWYEYDERSKFVVVSHLLNNLLNWDIRLFKGEIPDNEIRIETLYRIIDSEEDFLNEVLEPERNVDSITGFREDFCKGKYCKYSYRYLRRFLHKRREELNESFKGMATLVQVAESSYTAFELGERLPDKCRLAKVIDRVAFYEEERVEMFRAYIYDWCITCDRKTDYALLLSVIRLTLGEDLNTMRIVSRVNWSSFEYGNAPQNYPQTVLEYNFGVPDYYDYASVKHTITDIVELGIKLGKEVKDKWSKEALQSAGN